MHLLHPSPLLPCKQTKQSNPLWTPFCRQENARYSSWTLFACTFRCFLLRWRWPSPPVLSLSPSWYRSLIHYHQPNIYSCELLHPHTDHQSQPKLYTCLLFLTDEGLLTLWRLQELFPEYRYERNLTKTKRVSTYEIKIFFMVTLSYSRCSSIVRLSRILHMASGQRKNGLWYWATFSNNWIPWMAKARNSWYQTKRSSFEHQRVSNVGMFNV